MRNKGYITIEAILVFPIVVFIIALFIYLIVTITIMPEDGIPHRYMDDIQKIDSLKRKAEVVTDVFK